MIDWIKTLPHELIVLVMAASPVVELRGSIPMGLKLLGLNNSLPILLISILGSILPVFPLFWFLNNFTKYLRKLKPFDAFFSWLFARTRAKSKLIEEYELIGLALFVAIPLPVTGVWTGCVAAYLFRLPWALSFLSITIGTTIAGLIVLLVSTEIINLLSYF